MERKITTKKEDAISKWLDAEYKWKDAKDEGQLLFETWEQFQKRIEVLSKVTDFYKKRIKD